MNKGHSSSIWPNIDQALLAEASRLIIEWEDSDELSCELAQRLFVLYDRNLRETLAHSQNMTKIWPV
jgi:hypothetical protein